MQSLLFFLWAALIETSSVQFAERFVFVCGICKISNWKVHYPAAAAGESLKTVLVPSHLKAACNRSSKTFKRAPKILFTPCHDCCWSLWDRSQSPTKFIILFTQVPLLAVRPLDWGEQIFLWSLFGLSFNTEKMFKFHFRFESMIDCRREAIDQRTCIVHSRMSFGLRCWKKLTQSNLNSFEMKILLWS